MNEIDAVIRKMGMGLIDHIPIDKTVRWSRDEISRRVDHWLVSNDATMRKGAFKMLSDIERLKRYYASRSR